MLGVIFGGESFEHEISIVSTISLKDYFDIFIFLDDENFYLIPKDKLKADFFSQKEYKKEAIVYLRKNSFYQKSFLKEKEIKATFVNLIHGASGEDGEIASLLSFYNIPFIGPNIEASCISFNKYLTKLYAKDKGVNVLDYWYFNKNNIPSVTFPVIIKPARLGSSIGLSIANNIDEFNYALDVAFEFDNDILVENFIKGIKEYNLAGVKIGEEFIFSKIEEVKKDDFLSFDDKYLDFSSKEKKEAEINEDLKYKLQDSFRKIYDNLFDNSIIRCDFFVIDNEVYLNEINPIPGSLAAYLFDDFKSVLNKLKEKVSLKNRIKIKYNYITHIKSIKK